MSEHPPQDPEATPAAAPAAAAARDQKRAKIRRRWSRRRIGTTGFLVIFGLIVLTGLVVRFGAATDAGRAAILKLAEGRPIGRYGRLHLEGLSGDVFHDFQLDRLSVSDAKGTWVEGRNISLRWDLVALLFRRFEAEQLHAEVVRVLRKPDLSPPSGAPGGGGMPVSVVLRDLKLRLETLPAVSVRNGVWDVSGAADVRRSGAVHGRLDASSRLHAGDGVAALFQFDPRGVMDVRADAVEGAGGALAGALGLPADQRFQVQIRIHGKADADGAMSVSTQSGARRPVTASGAWNRAGASLDARVALESSSLSAGYVSRIGPEVHLTIRARALKDGLAQLDAAAVAKEVSVTVNGPVDWRRRTSSGLAVDLAMTQVHQWVDALNAGPARATGTLSGQPDRWRFEGRAQVEALDQFGYRLARAGGPTTLAFTRGDLRVQTDLSTAGGKGDGLAGALLGQAPRVKLDATRLARGQILVKALAVDGQGLTLRGSGDRSLLGALSFKGDATLTGLERARPGAKGTLKASWTANQAGKAPWSFSLDARGEGFATGYDELDRLLGQAPRVTADASYGPGLTIARAELTGATVQAAVKGGMDTKLALDLDVDWRAQGPFAAGPVEVTGEAQGTGKVRGLATAPSVDLAADLAAVDFGQLSLTPAHLTLQLAMEGGLNGQLGLTGPTKWGPASAKAKFRFVSDGLDLSDIAADAGGVKAAGALALRDGAPSSADLTVAAGPGLFLSQGRLAGAVKIQDRPGGAVAQIALDGAGLALPGMSAGLKSVHLKADGPFARLPFQVSAEADQPLPWRFAGDGLLVQTGSGAAVVRELSLNGAGRIRHADIRTADPIRVRLSGAERSLRGRLSIGAGRLDLDARQAGEAIQAKADLEGIDISVFAYNYMGVVTGSLALNGSGQRLTGAVDAAVTGGRDHDAPADVALSAKVHAVLNDTAVQLDASATNPQGLQARLSLGVPAEASAAPFRVALVRTRPINGAFDAEGELRPLWDLFAGSGRTLSGKGAVHAALGGTLNALRPTGQATLENGRFQDAGIGLDLRNLGAQAGFDRDAVDISRFSADDGHGGSLSGSGKVSVLPEGASTFTLDLKGFRLIDNKLARASASGQVTVTRDTAGKAKLAGALTIDRADISASPPAASGVAPMEVIEINKPGADPDAPGPRVGPGGPQIQIAVDLRASRGVFIKGNGLDAELSLQAHVGGTTAAPDLSGTARIVRGDYQFAGKRFEFDDRGSIRLASHPEQVRIDLTATRDDPTLTAIVRIQGTATKPEITFSSNPVLPQDEVLSQVLFGRSASQLSPLEAAQLASAVSGLATGGGLDVLGNLRQFAELDRLAVSGGGGGEAATVSGGKYLTDDVYLELTGGGREGPTAQVEWRVRRTLSLVSTVGARGDARLSVKFRKSFGKQTPPDATPAAKTAP